MNTPLGVFGACFIEGARGRLLVTLRRPEVATTGSCALFIPPFGEEMNKTRRMYALTAAALAEAGTACLGVDLYGTGDSEGEFRDATWEGWLQDLASACAWARAQGWQVDRLLASRLGCAMAVQFGVAHPGIHRTVWWQPVLDGKRYLTQFLRIRAMASETGSGQDSVPDIRARLAAGETLEVGGYDLSSALFHGVEALAAPVSAQALGEIHWFDVVREAGSPAASPSSKFLTDVSSVTRMPVVGEPFWSTVEVVTVPRLVEQSTLALAARRG
jgi:exosortase A-associated hydrolase 2